MSHPMQPIELDPHGVARFKGNAIIDHLFKTRALDLNKIAGMGFSGAEWMQIAQLLGYTVGGFADLDYATDEMVEAADAAVDRLVAEEAAAASQAASGTTSTGSTEAPVGSTSSDVEQWARECGPDQVFVLLNRGQPTGGVYRSVAGAQARAAEILREYQETFAELSAEEQDETELLDDELDWAIGQDALQLGDRCIPLGGPRPVAVYSDSSSFAIRRETLHRSEDFSDRQSSLPASSNERSLAGSSYRPRSGV